MLIKILNRIYLTKNNLSQNLFNNLIKFKYFEKFNLELKEKTNTKLDPHFKLRCNEIFNIIKKKNIKKILEIGTGRTTFLFNCFEGGGISICSMEQDIEWKEKLIELLKKYKINSNIILSDIEKLPNGAKFSNIPNFEPDLLYIDGPYYPKPRKKTFDTFGGKPAYYDFKTLFDRNIFPKVIMIEGRISTVEEITKSSYFNKYHFEAEYAYYLKKNDFISALKFKRHSVFIRKD
jgi:hypothetical protein